jgi:hypothetical protein
MSDTSSLDLPDEECFLLPPCISETECLYYTSCQFCIAVLDWYIEQTVNDPSATSKGRDVRRRPELFEKRVTENEQNCCNNKDMSTRGRKWSALLF